MMSRSLLSIAVAALVGAAVTPVAAAPQQGHDNQRRTPAQSKAPVTVAAKSKAPVK